MVQEDSDCVSDFCLLITDSTWQDLLAKTSELRHCDLDLLEDDNEKICFFINLYNMMNVHAWSHATEQAEKEKKMSKVWRNGVIF